MIEDFGVEGSVILSLDPLSDGSVRLVASKGSQYLGALLYIRLDGTITRANLTQEAIDAGFVTDGGMISVV